MSSQPLTALLLGDYYVQNLKIRLSELNGEIKVERGSKVIGKISFGIT